MYSNVNNNIIADRISIHITSTSAIGGSGMSRA